jgi:hypothetical protein
VALGAQRTNLRRRSLAQLGAPMSAAPTIARR